MNGLILANGEPPSRQLCRGRAAKAQWILCCDGACLYAKAYGLTPDMIVGDMDSIGEKLPESFANIPLVKYPVEKDATDLQLAIELTLKKGCTSIEIIGGTGRRTDHLLGNIQLLLYLAKKNIPATMIDSYNFISVVTGTVPLEGKEGDLVSIIPLSSNLRITTENLKYSLKEHLMPADQPLGISNVLLQSPAAFHISGGYAVLVRPFKG